MANWKNTRRKRPRRRRAKRSQDNFFRFGKVKFTTAGLLRLAKWSFLGFVILALTFFISVPLLSFTLPSPENIVRREGFSTKILDRNGEVLYDIFKDARRSPVESIEAVPDYLKQATIAIEDKNFYAHQGFDPFGMLRGFSRIFTRGYAQGGSTLTQQLVKNVLLTSDRSISRKIKEFVLAIQIENRYSKDEILLLYLNEVPYGGTAYGVEAASQIYFGKPVSELNLVESAFLAGLPQRPSVYSPYSSTPDAYIARSQQVLRRMREDGYITKEQEESAKEQLPNLEFQERGASFKAPHFVQYVQKILEERYGDAIVETGGLEVTTTLDLQLQEEAQRIVSEEIAKVEALNITNGAAVVIDPETGEILAMVGSKEFNAPDYDGQVNVTTSLRQPGSTIKPFTYVTGLKEGYTASYLFMDVPTTFPGGIGQPDYEPVNYDGEYRGPVQFRYALANSINIPAVKMLALVGIQDTLQTAFDMGLTTLEPTRENLSRLGLSLTLGGGEVRLLDLTTAYSPFMNGGYKVEPVSILKVVDQNGNILEENSPDKGRRVISEAQAYIIADILADNEARSEVFGPNSLLNIPDWQVAVKTGTTNDLRDNWAVGGNGHGVVGVWVGNNDNSQMESVASGISGATPIWRKIVLELLKGKPNITFSRPDSVVTASVDVFSGYREHDGFPSRTEIFEVGTEPGEDSVHVLLKVCNGGQGLATPSQIAAGVYEEKEYFVFDVQDPTSGPREPNRWMEGIQAWTEQQSDPRYSPPTEYCDSGNLAPLNIEFIDPKDRQSGLSKEVNFKFVIDSVNDIEVAWLEIDGKEVASFENPPFEYSTSLKKGAYKVRAAARDSQGNESERIIQIGVETQWDEATEEGDLEE